MNTKEALKAHIKIAVMDMLLERNKSSPVDEAYTGGVIDTLEAILNFIDTVGEVQG